MPFRLRTQFPFPAPSPPAFQFSDPGPLIDGQLQLVPPSAPWVDAVLAICRHPKSLTESPSLCDTTRQQLLGFLSTCPNGHQRPNAAHGVVPAYYFWMQIAGEAALPIAGGIGLRSSNNYDTVMYSGHIGYHVYPPHRGNHYAERACRLLFPLAAQHGLNPLWITCNPDNFASRRTCERLGGQLVEIVPVPEEHSLYQRGEREKCRYRIDL